TGTLPPRYAPTAIATPSSSREQTNAWTPGSSWSRRSTGRSAVSGSETAKLTPPRLRAACTARAQADSPAPGSGRLGGPARPEAAAQEARRRVHLPRIAGKGMRVPHPGLPGRRDRLRRERPAPEAPLDGPGPVRGGGDGAQDDAGVLHRLAFEAERRARRHHREVTLPAAQLLEPARAPPGGRGHADVGDELARPEPGLPGPRIELGHRERALPGGPDEPERPIQR